jgi:hypothetical protein
MGATRGLGSMRPTVLASQVGRQVGQLVTVGAVMIVDGDLTAVGVAWAVPYLVTVAYPALWLRSRLPRHGQLELTDADRYWRYTVPQAANTTAQTGLEKFDLIALGFLAGSVAQGEYSVANRMAHVVVLGWYAVNLAQAPIYARLFAAGRDQELRRVVQSVSGWAVVLVAPVLWVYIVFAGVVARLFGPGFGASGDPLVILSIALLVALLFGPSENLLLMSGRSTRAFANNVMALAANISLNLLLVPDHGITGAAIAWMVAVLFTRGTAAVQVASERGVYAIGRPLIEAWLAAAICFGGVGVMARVWMGATVAALVFTLVVGTVLLAVVVGARRNAMQFDALLAALTARRGKRPGDVADTGRLESAPHLRLALRSATVVALDAPMATRRRAVAAVQAGGWKGRLARASLGRLFVALPGGTARLLPLVTRTAGADLPVPAEIASGAVRDALDRLADSGTNPVDGVVWLVPPRSDGARAAALLVAGDEAVAHLRISCDLVPVRPDPTVPRGPRTGIEWPMILDRWTRADLAVELSTVVDIGTHVATEIDLPTLLALIEDLGEALGDPGTRWATPMHGDLTPWNLRRSADRLVLFDSEHRGFGPREADLVRYLATASDGLELFEALSSARRVGAVDAIRWYTELGLSRVDRAEASELASRWKKRDQAAEMERLAELSRRAR